MGGTRLGAALVILLTTGTALNAQPATFSGFLTGHFGAGAGGDVRQWAVTPGASIAVIDEAGFGAEIDGSYSRNFDDQFVESSITAVMLNFIAMYPHDLLRPYLVAGAGVVRVRAAFLPGQAAIGQNETAWNAGGGVLYLLNEALGFRVDFRYVRQFSRQDTFPLGPNGRLDYVRTSFGVTYSWPLQ